MASIKPATVQEEKEKPRNNPRLVVKIFSAGGKGVFMLLFFYDNTYMKISNFRICDDEIEILSLNDIEFIFPNRIIKNSSVSFYDDSIYLVTEFIEDSTYEIICGSYSSMKVNKILIG